MRSMTTPLFFSFQVNYKLLSDILGICFFITHCRSKTVLGMLQTCDKYLTNRLTSHSTRAAQLASHCPLKCNYSCSSSNKSYYLTYRTLCNSAYYLN